MKGVNAREYRGWNISLSIDPPESLSPASAFYRCCIPGRPYDVLGRGITALVQ